VSKHARISLVSSGFCEAIFDSKQERRYDWSLSWERKETLRWFHPSSGKNHTGGPTMLEILSAKCENWSEVSSSEICSVVSLTAFSRLKSTMSWLRSTYKYGKSGCSQSTSEGLTQYIRRTTIANGGDSGISSRSCIASKVGSLALAGSREPARRVCSTAGRGRGRWVSGREGCSVTKSPYIARETDLKVP